MNMNKSPFVIGISGASGSGKTWFANKLKEELTQSACIFTLDSYYKDVDYVNQLEHRHDNPKAIDFDKAYADLSTLIRGEVLKLPVYDYDTHKVVSEHLYEPTSVIIIEGLFAFSDYRLLDAMKMKIWIEAYETIRFERRISRDINERGDNYEDALFRIQNDAEPAYQKFTRKGIEYADCVFLNIKNSNKSPLLVSVLNEYIKDWV